MSVRLKQKSIVSELLHFEEISEVIRKAIDADGTCTIFASGLNQHVAIDLASRICSPVARPIRSYKHPVSKPTNQKSTFEKVNNVLVSHNARVMAVKSLNLNPAAEAMAIRKVTEETTTTLMKMTPVLQPGKCCCNTDSNSNWKQEVLNNAYQEYQSIDDLGDLNTIHHSFKRLFVNYPDMQLEFSDMYFVRESWIKQRRSSADLVVQRHSESEEDLQKINKQMQGIIDKYKGKYKLHEKVCTPDGLYKLKQELLYLRDKSNLFIGESKDFPDKNYLYFYWALDGAKIFNPKYKVDEKTGKKQSPAWGKFAGFINDILELGLESKENGITNLAAAMSKVLRDNKNYSIEGCEEQYCQCCKDPHYFSNLNDDNYDELAANVSIAIQRLKDNVLK